MHADSSASRLLPAAPSTARSAASLTRHIVSLDGIRAVSFLLVFLAHAGLEDLVPGGLGVTIFFFLSGFLITTLMRSEYETDGAVNLGHFWLRRSLRILPPFYVVLLGATVAALVFDPPRTLSAGAVAAQFLHVTNYRIILYGGAGLAAGTGVYWSLAVEEHFYLLFPWLYVAMLKLRLPGSQQAAVLWTLCGIALIWRYALVLGWHVSMERTYVATDTRVDSILFGCALAVWCNPVLDAPPINERRWKLVIVPAALAVLVACLLFRGPVFRETLRYSLQGVALTFIFVAAIRFADWAPFRLLNLRPVAFLGVLSYSLYLLHQVVIIAVRRVAPTWHPFIQGVMALVISITLAWMIYRLIEKPCARLRKALSPRGTRTGLVHQ